MQTAGNVLPSISSILETREEVNDEFRRTRLGGYEFGARPARVAGATNAVLFFYIDVYYFIFSFLFFYSTTIL